MILLGVGIDDFDIDSVDLVLKLSRPVQIVCVWLNKEDLPFEDSNRIDRLFIVVWQVYYLMVEVLIVLMSFYYTDRFAFLILIP